MPIQKLRRFSKILSENGLDTAIIASAYHFDAIGLHHQLLNQLWGFDANTSYKLKIINANVDRITHTHKFPFRVRGENAVIGTLAGNWDKMANPFHQTQLYRSLEIRFNEEAPWEETPIYKKARRRIKNDGQSWNSCQSVPELQGWCEKIDRLYMDMKENGYQHQLNEDWTRSIRGVSVPDEIRIAVGRDGHFIRCASGKHRLAIAKLLDINTVPATVQIVHNDWNDDLESYRKSIKI